MTRRPPRSTLFPYPTLSRSRRRVRGAKGRQRPCPNGAPPAAKRSGWTGDANAPCRRQGRRMLTTDSVLDARKAVRSEEHTSELQSRQYLVCRLLLEKKKTTH